MSAAARRWRKGAESREREKKKKREEEKAAVAGLSSLSNNQTLDTYGSQASTDMDTDMDDAYASESDNW